MQQPTCTDLRIRSTADAHKIFAAVKQGLLHMITRRLDADERLALRSGCIYAWEERGPHTETSGLGIERFTEGRRWSPSRVRDDFLFYYERYSPPQDLNNPGGKLAEVKPPRDWDPLVKQTYSVWVETEKGRRKWHLTSYFTQATIDQLSTVDDTPHIRELVVPEGMFKSTRLVKNRSRPDENGSEMSKVVASRSYAPYPSPYHYQTPQRGSPNIQPIFMQDPYQGNQSSEPQPPAYESSHSPVPTQEGGLYHHQNPVAYYHPNENGSQPFLSNSYHRPSIALPNLITSFSHSKSNSIPPSVRHDAHNYYPPSGSPSPWNNDNGLDYSNSPPPPHCLVAELEIPSSPMTPSSPPTYGLAENGSFDYVYPPIQNNPTPLYSTLNSGYTVPPSSGLALPNLAERGVHPSPLSIPERSNGVHYRQDPSPISPTPSPTLQNGPESYARTPVPALAPLTVIQRPNFRREPLDEMTLRLLRASPANR